MGGGGGGGGGGVVIVSTMTIVLFPGLTGLQFIRKNACPICAHLQKLEVWKAWDDARIITESV